MVKKEVKEAACIDLLKIFCLHNAAGYHTARLVAALAPFQLLWTLESVPLSEGLLVFESHSE